MILFLTFFLLIISCDCFWKHSCFCLAFLSKSIQTTWCWYSQPFFLLVSGTSLNILTHIFSTVTRYSPGECLTLSLVSQSAVVVPHGDLNYDHERCEASCTPGSLGVLRSSSSLCRPSQSQCRQEVNMTEMTDKLCEAWAMMFPFLLPSGRGQQVVADPALGSWLPCSVFCQTVSGSWYSPRRELEEYHLSVNLPEGLSVTRLRSTHTTARSVHSPSSTSILRYFSGHSLPSSPPS